MAGRLELTWRIAAQASGLFSGGLTDDATARETPRRGRHRWRGRGHRERWETAYPRSLPAWFQLWTGHLSAALGRNRALGCWSGGQPALRRATDLQADRRRLLDQQQRVGGCEQHPRGPPARAAIHAARRLP